MAFLAQACAITNKWLHSTYHIISYHSMLDAAGQGGREAAPSTMASSCMQQHLVRTLSKSRRDRTDLQSASAVQGLLDLYIVVPATEALAVVLCLHKVLLYNVSSSLCQQAYACTWQWADSYK